MQYKQVDINSIQEYEGNEKEALVQLINKYNELVNDYNKLNIQLNKVAQKSSNTLSFGDLQSLQDYQIRYTTILQNSNGICDFFEEAKILDLSNDADQWINPELVKLFFRTAKVYGVGEAKRSIAGVKQA